MMYFTKWGAIQKPRRPSNSQRSYAQYLLQWNTPTISTKSQGHDLKDFIKCTKIEVETRSFHPPLKKKQRLDPPISGCAEKTTAGNFSSFAGPKFSESKVVYGQFVTASLSNCVIKTFSCSAFFWRCSTKNRQTDCLFTNGQIIATKTAE